MEERVDAWGESQKAARKNLPLERARIQRSYRRAVRLELTSGDDADPGRLRRKLYRKWSTPTRREHLDGNRRRREALEHAPRKSEAARERRRQRRGGHRHR